VLACALIGPAASATAQVPEPAAPVTIDGPSTDIVGLSGMSVARDGTGGIVYLKQVLGVPHVFVSRLVGGVFQRPEQLDGGLIGPSSQPVIASGNGGLLLVAFINGGQLYVVSRVNSLTPYAGPSVLAAGASNPSLELTSFGKAYLAFTVSGSGGHDVRAAYYHNGAWGLEATPLDADPNDDAGTGGGRPRVAAATDGVAIVVWGEAGHIYARRVWGLSPSVVYEQADVPSLDGWSEVSADQPEVAAGGDSSYAQVVFHEVFANGAQRQSRVLSRRLRGSQFESIAQPDGLRNGSGSGGVDPQVVMGEFGQGLITAAHDDSNQLFATPLAGNGVVTRTIRVDSLTNAADPEAAPAMAGYATDLIAWQEDPGDGSAPEIRMRYSVNGTSFGPEQVISSPAGPAPNAADGLLAGGDYAGDAVVAWVRGTGPQTQIVADQLYQPPSAFAADSKFRYVRSARPVLSWSPARDHWGPVRYAVRIDGTVVSQTTRTTVRVPVALSQGPHHWFVTASNPAGLAVNAKAGRVWVDTVRPRVTFTLKGTRQIGKVLRLTVKTSDRPPVAIPPTTASGVVSVVVKFGDGKSFRIRRTKDHVYTRARRYRLTIIVKDRAGNKTTVVRTVKISAGTGPGSNKRKLQRTRAR
jgi:hypothetical protein